MSEKLAIHIEFLAQLGHLAGGKRRSLNLDAECTAQDAVRAAIAEDSEEFRGLVLDEHGQLRPSILMFVADAQIDWHVPVPLRDADTIVLSPPIAGG